MVALLVGTFVSPVQRLVPQFAADPDLVDRHAGEGAHGTNVDENAPLVHGHSSPSRASRSLHRWTDPVRASVHQPGRFAQRAHW
jgi:hypothetical protein